MGRYGVQNDVLQKKEPELSEREVLGTGYVESAISAPATQSASHETIYDVTLFFFVLADFRPPTTLRYVS